ncbi:MAG: Gfo/Idh/MocA family oxidoreductase [Planctomycetota bacterium]
MPSPISRRQFHHRLGLAGLAAGVHAAGQNSFAAMANGSIETCVVGVNGRGGSHINSLLKDPRTKITTIVDIDTNVAEKVARKIIEQQGTPVEFFSDVREALESGSFDVLTCATPNHWHALCGIWAMQAGKDVYIEKPISHNVQEGRALVETAKQYGRMFQTGTQCRSSAACIDAVKFIEDGKIGEVNFARGLCYKRRKSIGPLGDYPIPEKVDFDLWSGPAPLTDPRLTRQKFHYDWHWQRHYGNGDSGNQGPHQTDVARWGLGLERHPNAILTYAGRLGYQAERNDKSYIDAGDTANTQVSIYDYGDKTITFETRGLDVGKSDEPEIRDFFGDKPGNKIGVIFYGTEGYVAQVSYGRCVATDKDRNVIAEFKASGDLNGEHFGNFLDAVESRDSSTLNADAMCGHLSASVAHLGNIGYYLGQKNLASPSDIETALGSIASRDDDQATLRRTVEHLSANGVKLNETPLSLGPKLVFDADSETFVDNDAANDMLSREYRAGFEVTSLA